MKHTIQLIIALALGLPGAAAMATEEPKFERIAQHDHIELRRYPAFIVAETFVAGDLDQASVKGFRTIADYIFGNNVAVGPDLLDQPQASEKIAMTAPVTVAPADQGASPMAGNRWRVHFVMPSQYQLSDLPSPNSNAVSLVRQSSMKLAVLRFGGFSSDEKIAKHAQLLTQVLEKNNIRTKGSLLFMGYNAPWDVINRRNEVAFQID